MKKLLLILVILSVALVVIPLVVAIPFITQTPALLAVAHAAQNFAPAVSAISALLAAAIVVRSRSVLSWVALALVLIAAVMSRVNSLEWVFAPASNTETAAIGQFRDIRDDDMVIGVVIGGESRAYPVRYLEYHHMLNDRLGATALLPTY